MMRLHMSPQDIFKEYREAKDPKAQIKILADQNVCAVRDIIDILISFGVEIKQRKKRKPSVGKIRWSEELIKQVEQLYFLDVNDREIADMLETSVANVRRVMYENGMPEKKKALGDKNHRRQSKKDI